MSNAPYAQTPRHRYLPSQHNASASRHCFQQTPNHVFMFQAIKLCTRERNHGSCKSRGTGSVTVLQHKNVGRKKTTLETSDNLPSPSNNQYFVSFNHNSNYSLTFKKAFFFFCFLAALDQNGKIFIGRKRSHAAAVLLLFFSLIKNCHTGY